jgi:hypothetical protein
MSGKPGLREQKRDIATARLLHYFGRAAARASRQRAFDGDKIGSVGCPFYPADSR